MDLSYKQEVTVGGLVLIAIILFVVGTTWLGGGTVGGNMDEYWRVQFRDVGGLKLSSAVRVSGVPVGRVENIRLVEAGKVMVAVSLDEGVVPKTDARAEVVSVGFVGDAAIDLYPGNAPEPLPRTQVIVGTQAAGITSRAEQLAQRADSVLMGVQAVASQRTADELVQTMDALQATLRAVQRTMEVYGNPNRGPAAALTAATNSLQGLAERLDSTLANPALASLMHRADTLTSRLAEMSAQFRSTGAQLDTLLAAVNQGEGTLGKFATDSTLYVEMRTTTQALTNLLTELTERPGQISPSVKVCIIPLAC